MSRDDDFHKLIENQDKEQKELMWNKIQCQVNEKDVTDNVNDVGEVLAFSKNESKKRNIILCCAIILTLVLCLFLGLLLRPKSNPDDIIDDNNPNDTIDDDNSDGTIDGSNNEYRYCTFNDYYTENTISTLKQYAIDNEINLLYFDFYDYSEYYSDIQYKLNGTQEVICLFEEIYDSNFAFINIYITDNKTDIDAVQYIKNICDEEIEIKSIKVEWSNDADKSYAKFEYKGYFYYISVEYDQDSEYILSLIQNYLF